jgi:hypothetical protein
MTTMMEIWIYRDDTWAAADLTGFEVEASDGHIGKVDDVRTDAGATYLIVDTGPWIFGKKVMLPAGVVDRVDHDAEQVFVECSKDQIKSAPEFDEGTYLTDEYRTGLGSYYERQKARAYVDHV